MDPKAIIETFHPEHARCGSVPVRLPSLNDSVRIRCGCSDGLGWDRVLTVTGMQLASLPREAA